MVRNGENLAQPQSKIDYLFTGVQLPGAPAGENMLYAGWTANLLPIVVTRDSSLSAKALKLKQANTPAAFPFERSIVSYAPSVLEFKRMAKPVDNADEASTYTQDIIVLSGVNTVGSMGFLRIEELTLLDAIERGQVEWNVGGFTQYSLLVPDESARKLHVVLFSPNGGDSNELQYRTFLLQTIKSLVELDRGQVPPDQKGYFKVIQAILAGLQKKESENKPQVSRLEKIVMDMGVLKEAEEVKRNYLGELSVEQLREVIHNFHIYSKKAFDRGRE